MTYISFLDSIYDNFANLHLQIKSYSAGMYDDMVPTFTESEDWPIMYVVPTSVTNTQYSSANFNLRIYFLDLLEKDLSNERDVFSDQLSIARDFINWLRLNDSNDLDLLNDPSATPVKSIGTDFTAGWYVDVEVEVSFEGSDCTIPFAGSGPAPVTCPVSYVLNSDGSYSVTLSAGGTLTLPDVTLSINGSVVETYPSVQNIAINVTLDGVQDGTWDGTDTLEITTTPANVEINGVLFDTVFGGQTLDIPVIAIGGTTVGSTIGPDYVIDNCQPTFNGVAMDSIKAEETKAYTILLDGVQAGSATSPTQWDITSAPCPDAGFRINGSLVESIPSGTYFDLITKLDGVVNSGTYNAGTDTLSFTSATGWIRPSDWIAIPSLTSADERFYGVVAVFENAYNQVSVAITNLAANINWGDGTSVVSNGAQQVKVYNYSTLSATVYQWPDGRNYKMALVDITRVGGALASIDFWTQTAVNYLGGNNFIDINCSLPNTTTLLFSLDQLSGVKGMQMLQRLRVWQRPVGHAAANLCRGMRSLRVLEYPFSRLGSVSGFMYDSGQLDMFPDCNYGTSTTIANMMLQTKTRKHGNLSGTSVTNAQTYCQDAAVMTEFGTITLPACTAMNDFFAASTGSPLLTKVGLIDTPLVQNLSTFAFRSYSLQGLTFVNCAAVTNTSSMITLCTSLYYLIMPGLTRGVNFTGTAIGNYGMSLFANSIGTASGAQSITYTGTPFGVLITAGDVTALAIRTVMTGKGYTMVN